MSTTHSHDLSRHVRIYLAVFLALLVGTIVTVGMYYVHFQNVTVTITVALFIASVKASLVAGFFMHLISERKAIYAIMGCTVFFVAALLFLTVWSRDQVPRGMEYLPSKYVPLAMPATPLR
jgi:cytochrome c oxidase subunit 4